MSEYKSKYEVLRELLIGDDLDKQDELDQELSKLRQEIKVREKLEQNVEPILTERIMRLKREFPQEFGPAMMKAIEQQAQEQPEQLRSALAPIVTDIVRDFLSDRWYQFREKLGLLKRPTKDPTRLYADPPEDSEEESFEAQSPEETPQLNDIFVIENKSLALLGHHSKFEGKDDPSVQKGIQDMINDLVREAVEYKQQSLDWHHYDHYKVYLITFKRLSVACTILGTPDMRYKNTLEDQVMEFAKDLLPEMRQEDEEYNRKLTERFLRNHFQQL